MKFLLIFILLVVSCNNNAPKKDVDGLARVPVQVASSIASRAKETKRIADITYVDFTIDDMKNIFASESRVGFKIGMVPTVGVKTPYRYIMYIADPNYVYIRPVLMAVHFFAFSEEQIGRTFQLNKSYTLENGRTIKRKNSIILDDRYTYIYDYDLLDLLTIKFGDISVTYTVSDNIGNVLAVYKVEITNP